MGTSNFFVDWRSQFDHVLRDHLKSTGPRYLSPKVQNEIIRCCETEIREKIVNDCNNSGFFAICCDETTDVSTKEQILYVSDLLKIRISERNSLDLLN